MSERIHGGMEAQSQFGGLSPLDGAAHSLPRPNSLRGFGGIQALAPPQNPHSSLPLISPCGPKGAKCDRPGQRPGCPHQKTPALKGRNTLPSLTDPAGPAPSNLTPPHSPLSTSLNHSPAHPVNPVNPVNLIHPVQSRLACPIPPNTMGTPHSPALSPDGFNHRGIAAPFLAAMHP